MSLSLAILKKAELFLSLAANDIEKTRSSRRKWFAAQQAKWKANPDDPGYLDYLAYRKQQYDLGQQLLDTDPEALNKYLDDLNTRQKKFIEKLKQDPEKFKAFQEKKNEKSMARLEEARRGTDLESKVLLFGRQIAFKRSDEKKKYQKKSFPEYEQNQQKLNELTDYINKLRSFMYGSKEGTFLANLEFLVTDGMKKVREIRSLSPRLSENLLEIVNILDLQLSQYRGQGLVT